MKALYNKVGNIFTLWGILLLLAALTGCGAYDGLNAPAQVKGIKACTDADLQWKYRRNYWNGNVQGIECAQPHIYHLTKEQITYDNCISSNIKYTFTDMDIVKLEEFCSTHSLKQ